MLLKLLLMLTLLLTLMLMLMLMLIESTQHCENSASSGERDPHLART
jgi:hypothetical protein